MSGKDVSVTPHGTGDAMECPYCDWEMQYDPDSHGSTLAAEVDAEMHFENEHPGEELPPGYKFGQFQCPECYRMDGMEGTASCKHCGHIPEKHRA